MQPQSVAAATSQVRSVNWSWLRLCLLPHFEDNISNSSCDLFCLSINLLAASSSLENRVSFGFVDLCADWNSWCHFSLVSRLLGVISSIRQHHGMATHRLSTLHPTSCYPKYSLRKKSRHIPKFLIFFLEPVSMVYQPFTLFDVMGTNFSRRLRYLPHPCEVPLSSKMGQWKRSCRKKSLKHLRINQSLKKR